MAVDPNDLLIFKLRGMATSTPSPRQNIQPQVQTQVIQKSQKQQKVEYKAPEVQAPPTPPPTAPPSPPPQSEATSIIGINAKLAPKKKVISEEELEKAMEPGVEEELESKVKKEMQHMESVQIQPNQVYDASHLSGRLTKAERESIQAAQGYYCVNHPWRPAYAICDYCKRPFCYADLVEFNGRFYCLEDIDKVAGKSNVQEVKTTKMWQLPGAVFILNAAIMAFFLYPQIGFLLNQIAKVGFSSFLFNMNYAYGIATLNFLIAIVSLVMGVIILLKPSHVYIGSIAGMLVLISVSYEYLNSLVSYLLAISILTFIATMLMVYNKITSTTTSSMEEIKPTDIEWPRLETF